MMIRVKKKKTVYFLPFNFFLPQKLREDFHELSCKFYVNG